MDELSPVLAEATQAIEPGYFRLAIDGGDPVYRERVYCYELYHQMRLRWPQNCPFYLNGEIDKAAHPILSNLGAGQAKPDLLIHQPGYMNGNHAIIEVKCTRARNKGIRKDIETVALFLGRVGYQRGIYLIYGDEFDRSFMDRIFAAAVEIGQLPEIEIWLHAAPGEPARPIETIGR
jgi:hypothetical protein